MRKYYPVPGLQGGGRKIGGGQPSGYLSFESTKELKRKSILPLIRLGLYSYDLSGKTDL